MKKSILLFAFAMAIVLPNNQIFAFCGFYVAGAGSELFNESSQIILVRDGDHTVVTMKNDYQGNMEEFAMVVPVPVLLKQSDIRVIDAGIFKTIDAYSSPRLVEYHDDNPCWKDKMVPAMAMDMAVRKEVKESILEFDAEDDYGVSIEARYEVGEYDILILSAEESDGLKRWLEDNDYNIPKQAEEVLEPYIKSNMKFFVAKVDVNKMPDPLNPSPIQISYNHAKFMLPIRLGMANSKGEQDLLVYAFTRKGRVECTNYRTVEMPTANKIPTWIEPRFGDFYSNVFDQQYRRQGRKAVFVEYAWDVSPQTAVKCDPCIAPPPIFADFQKAGVNWVSGINASSNVYFTRLHVRYSRDKFPQDLQFQVTPNKTNYQARYVMTHAAQGVLDCDEAAAYLEKVKQRKKLELEELEILTGWRQDRQPRYFDYLDQVKHSGVNIDVEKTNQEPNRSGLPIALGLILLTVTSASCVVLKRRNT